MVPLPPLAPDEILWQVALKEAGTIPFSKDCEADFRQLLQRTLIHKGGFDMEQAAKNTRLLVREMMKYAENGYLQERTLKKALAKLCPIFPFC